MKPPCSPRLQSFGPVRSCSFSGAGMLDNRQEALSCWTRPWSQVCVYAVPGKAAQCRAPSNRRLTKNIVHYIAGLGLRNDGREIWREHKRLSLLNNLHRIAIGEVDG